MAEQSGEVMVRSSAAGLPLSQPSNKDVSGPGAGKVFGETMASLHTHTEMGMTIED